MTLDFSAVVRKEYESFNSHDVQKVLMNVTDDVKAMNVPLGTTYTSKKGYGDFVKLWFDAFPDAKLEAKNIIGSGEIVAVEYVGTGTHRGILHTPMGDIPPTGRTGRLEGVQIFRLNKEGKIVESRLFYDALSLLTQIGIFRPETLGLRREAGAPTPAPAQM